MSLPRESDSLLSLSQRSRLVVFPRARERPPNRPLTSRLLRWAAAAQLPQRGDEWESVECGEESITWAGRRIDIYRPAVAGLSSRLMALWLAIFMGTVLYMVGTWVLLSWAQGDA